MAYTFAPQIGFGGKLEIDVNYPAAASWKEIDGLVDVTVNFDITEVEITSREQSGAFVTPTPINPNWADYLPGKASGEVTISIVFDPDATAAGTGHEVTVLQQLGITRQIRYTFADGSVWSAAGFFTRLPISLPMEDKCTADLTWRIRGAPTFTGDTD